MTDEAKTLFVKDTFGDTSHLSQAKSIIENDRKDREIRDRNHKTRLTLDEPSPKKKTHDPFAKSKIIPKINENVEAIVTATGQNGDETTARYVGKDKEDIESQVVDGMDIDKSDIHSIDIEGETDESRGYKADVDSEGKDKPEHPVEKIPSAPMAPVGGEMPQTGITENKMFYGRAIKEEEELQIQTLANGVQSIKIEYTKGIVNSLKLYNDLLSKAKTQYGLNDLAVRLEHHVEEDTKELENAMNMLDKSDREEIERYQKSLNEEVTETEGIGMEGGKADHMTIEEIAKKHGVSVETIQEQIEKGVKVEREHTDNDEIAAEIAMDHLLEFPDYYDRLLEMEKEAKSELKAKEEKEKIDLSDELTKNEKKRLDQEPSIDEKNELDPEKNNSEGTSDTLSKYIQGLRV
jgi:hypothetical protein